MTSTQHRPSQSSRVFRIVTWLLGAAVVVGIVIAVVQQYGQVEQRETPTIEGLVGQWKAAGLKVGTVEPLSEMLGAKRAAAIEVNGAPVHVYHFDVEDPKQLKALEEIRATKLADEDGKQVPGIANGAFVLTHYLGHRDEAAIVREFQGFGTFEGIEQEVKVDEGKP